MNKFLALVFSKKVLLGILSVSGILWLFGLFHRYIEADEYVLGEYSYTFLKEGTVRLKTIPEILDWDTRVFAHHRFFTWYGALIIQLFGWSITALKTSMLIPYALFFLLLYKYFKLENKDNYQFVLAALLIFTCPLIMLKSFSFRPDVLMMAEGMAIFYFLRKYRTTFKWKFALYAGAIAGLSFLTHLNGVAFCIAGFLFLIFTKEYKALLPFVGAGALIGGLYFVEFIEPGNFEKFIYELKNWPTVQHGDNYIGGGIWGIIEGRIVKLLSEHQRFFWSDKVLAFSILFILSIFLKFKYLKNNFFDALLFILLLILSLNLFGSSIAQRYIPFYYGPMAILSAAAITEIVRNMKLWKMTLMLLVIVLQLVFAGKMVMDIYQRSYDTVGSHKEILAKVDNQNNPSILVPFELVFNGYPDYNLYTFKTYEYLQEDMPEKMTSKELFQKAASLGMDYIIINKRMANDRPMWFYNWNIETPLYEIKYRDSEYALLERNSTQAN